MRSLAEQIEKYLKDLLAADPRGAVEVQRSELAQLFNCAPSQINYVLSTRFTAEQGYLVESRRGGAGYVRIIKLALDEEHELRRLVEEKVGELVSQQAAEGLLERLREEGFLTRREAMLMRAVIGRDTLMLGLPERDILRASIVRAMLVTILRDEFREEG